MKQLWNFQKKKVRAKLGVTINHCANHFSSKHGGVSTYLVPCGLSYDFALDIYFRYTKITAR